eukprot:CAMPEP_0172494542 /NCGR_PEP_ID=MMETSP1066-20121228/51198_1 /TAXON_ID=671091 /ORGANISM="Coscinodiscus wailesii, Strain CCMP2513" /LENGTH=205 /DNA_ID=CAMNT_0013265605 /DNA_START=663 /DNA_END=1280 /DNA_ORIENTATION=+
MSRDFETGLTKVEKDFEDRLMRVEKEFEKKMMAVLSEKEKCYECNLCKKPNVNIDREESKMVLSNITEVKEFHVHFDEELSTALEPSIFNEKTCQDRTNGQIAHPFVPVPSKEDSAIKVTDTVLSNFPSMIHDGQLKCVPAVEGVSSDDADSVSEEPQWEPYPVNDIVVEKPSPKPNGGEAELTEFVQYMNLSCNRDKVTVPSGR